MAATQSAQETARDAVQLFGGRGITKTGMGRFIEHVSSSFRRREYSKQTDPCLSVPPYYHIRLAVGRR